MCLPVLVPVDGWFLKIPAGLYANCPQFVECVSGCARSRGFKQWWVDGHSGLLRHHCEISPCYAPGLFGELFDVDHVPGCPDYVPYPLPPHIYND